MSLSVICVLLATVKKKFKKRFEYAINAAAIQQRALWGLTILLEWPNVLFCFVFLMALHLVGLTIHCLVAWSL